MAKRLFLSAFIALVACGMSFYLFYMVALFYASASGVRPLINDPGLQSVLRHVALPISVAMGIAAWVASFRGLTQRQRRQADKVVSIRS